MTKLGAIVNPVAPVGCDAHPGATRAAMTKAVPSKGSVPERGLLEVGIPALTKIAEPRIKIKKLLRQGRSRNLSTQCGDEEAVRKDIQVRKPREMRSGPKI